MDTFHLSIITLDFEYVYSLDSQMNSNPDFENFYS